MPEQQERASLSFASSNEIAQAVKQLFQTTLPPNLSHEDDTHPTMKIYKYHDGYEVIVFTVCPLSRGYMQYEATLDGWRYIRGALWAFWEVLTYIPRKSPVYHYARLVRKALSKYISAIIEAKSWHEFKSAITAFFAQEKIQQLLLLGAFQGV